MSAFADAVRRQLVLFGVAVGVFFTALIGLASPASAHVNFVASTPANVSTVSGPVTRVTLEYSGSADPITNDFIVEDSAGKSVPIASVGKDGDTKVVVTTVDPVPAGRNKVSWALRGADGHKMTGTISFTVASVAQANPSTTMATTTPTSPAAQRAVPNIETATTDAPPASTVSTSSSGGTDLAETIASIGRWLVYAMILFTVGSLSYLLWVHRGSKREGRRIVFLVRRAAILVILGSTIEWVAQLALYGSGSLFDVFDPKSWGTLLSTSFALGTVCRIVGAGMVLRFVPLEVVSEDPIDFTDLDDFDVFSDLGSGDSLAVAVATKPPSNLARVRLESGPLAFVGAVLLIASESFIGHTASVQPRVVMVVSDAAHLTAAAIWVAGVWLLTWTLWQRRRRGEPLDARLLATRFSVAATWALVAVAISGTVLGWSILGSPGRLFSTEFGRILVLKIVLVAVIAAIGLHNRRTLIPSLERPGVELRFFRTVMIEAVIFIVVLGATALLVVANPLP